MGRLKVSGRFANRRREMAAGVLVLRIVYGLGLLAKPESLTKRWLGSGRFSGSTQVALRGLAARETLIHAGALAALIAEKPLLPWFGASIACDLTDVFATVAARAELPDGSAPATVAVGGGAALITAGVAVAQRR
jgi:hypothetical protein